jgi:hypothetical protein
LGQLDDYTEDFGEFRRPAEAAVAETDGQAKG